MRTPTSPLKTEDLRLQSRSYCVIYFVCCFHLTVSSIHHLYCLRFCLFAHTFQQQLHQHDIIFFFIINKKKVYTKSPLLVTRKWSSSSLMMMITRRLHRRLTLSSDCLARFPPYSFTFEVFSLFFSFFSAVEASVGVTHSLQCCCCCCCCCCLPHLRASTIFSSRIFLLNIVFNYSGDRDVL